MNCVMHPETKASAECACCGSQLCEACIVHTQAKIFCRSCLARDFRTPPHCEISPKQKVNRGLLFIFTVFFPPGVGYMYMGLIKRGLFVMLGFFFLVFLLSTGLGSLADTFLGFSLIAVYFACIFDSFALRRRIVHGEVVEDGVDSMINGLLSNKKLCMAAVVVLVIVFSSSILDAALSLIIKGAPVLVILFGLYVIFRRKK